MDTEIILKSISNHTDQLSTLFTLMVVIAVAAIYMTLTRQENLNLIKGIKVQKRDAAIAGGLFLILIHIGLILTLWRIIALLKSVPDGDLLTAYTTIATHEWLGNPLAYFGESYAILSFVSFVALVGGWWIVLGSLSFLPQRYEKLEIGIGGSIFCLGLVLFILINEIYLILIQRLKMVSSQLSTELSDIRTVWLTNGWVLSVISFIVLAIALYFHTRANKNASDE